MDCDYITGNCKGNAITGDCEGDLVTGNCCTSGTNPDPDPCVYDWSNTPTRQYQVSNESVKNDNYGNYIDMYMDYMVTTHTGHVEVMQRGETFWYTTDTVGDGYFDDNRPVSVAIYDSYIAVGVTTGIEHNDRVVIFSKDMNDNWNWTQTIDGPVESLGYLFGSNVELDGDTLVVSANTVPLSGESTSGVVYIYVLVDDAFTLQQRLENPVPQHDSKFGVGISLDGDKLIVSTPGSHVDSDYEHHNVGDIRLYVRSSGVWSETDMTYDMDWVDNAYFAYSVSLKDNVVVCGTVAESVSGGKGWFTVFNIVNNQFVDVQKTFNPSGVGYQYFGYSVSIDNGVLAVGCPAGNSNQGVTYMYKINEGIYTPLHTLYSAAPDNGGNFGKDIILKHSVLAIGAPEENNTNTHDGSMYIFEVPCI